MFFCACSFGIFFFHSLPALQMGFDNDMIRSWEVAFQATGVSPIERVLTCYRHRNPTITDLFEEIRTVGNVRALRALQGLGEHMTVASMM